MPDQYLSLATTFINSLTESEIDFLYTIPEIITMNWESEAKVHELLPTLEAHASTYTGLNFESLKYKIVTLNKKCKITIIHKGNSVIIGVDNCILKLTLEQTRISQEKLNDLHDQGIFAKPRFTRTVDAPNRGIAIHITVEEKYDKNVKDFLGVSDISTDKNPVKEERIQQYLPLFLSMGKIFSNMQGKNILMADGKNTNFLTYENGSKLIIADFKNALEINTSGSIPYTPEFRPPEIDDLEKSLKTKQVKKDQVDKFHVFLLACNIIEGITQSEVKIKRRNFIELESQRETLINKIKNEELKTLLRSCIDADPTKRPTLEKALLILEKVHLETKLKQYSEEKLKLEAKLTQVQEKIKIYNIKELFKTNRQLKNKDPKPENTEEELFILAIQELAQEALQPLQEKITQKKSTIKDSETDFTKGWELSLYEDMEVCLASISKITKPSIYDQIEKKINSLQMQISIYNVTDGRINEDKIADIKNLLDQIQTQFHIMVTSEYEVKRNTLDEKIKTFLDSEINKLERIGGSATEKALAIKQAIINLQSTSNYSTQNYQPIIDALAIPRGWGTPRSIALFKDKLKSLNPNTEIKPLINSSFKIYKRIINSFKSPESEREDEIIEKRSVYKDH